MSDAPRTDPSATSELAGKAVWISGAGSGIGAATARRFAAAGARIFCVDLDGAAAQRTAGEVGGVAHTADVGDAAGTDAAFAACAEALGAVDVAFLNAGIAIGVSDVTQLDDDTYRRIMRVNVDGVVYGARAAVRHMREQGGGAIVATSSLAGLIPFPLDPVYDLTKHAVVGFIRSLAPTVVGDGITANCVNPGMTDTAILSDDAKRLFADAGFPLIAPEAIADAVHGLVTSGVTGQCWVCQPGREPVPYAFRDVPGPRGGGAEGRRPPALDAETREGWAR